MVKNTFAIFVSFMICFCYVSCKKGSIKHHLTSHENIELKLNESKPSNLTQSITFRAYGEEFKIDLQRYYPLYHHSKTERVLNKDNELEYLSEDNCSLYVGKVKGKKDSFVMGFFLQSGSFRGYVITDKVYCLESDPSMPNTTIIYRFMDVISPGCNLLDDGKTINCSEAKFFKPWLKSPKINNSTTKNLQIKPNLLTNSSISINEVSKLDEHIKKEITDILKKMISDIDEKSKDEQNKIADVEKKMTWTSTVKNENSNFTDVLQNNVSNSKERILLFMNNESTTDIENKFKDKMKDEDSNNSEKVLNVDGKKNISVDKDVKFKNKSEEEVTGQKPNKRLVRELRGLEHFATIIVSLIEGHHRGRKNDEFKKNIVSNKNLARKKLFLLDEDTNYDSKTSELNPEAKLNFTDHERKLITQNVSQVNGTSRISFGRHNMDQIINNLSESLFLYEVQELLKNTQVSSLEESSEKINDLACRMEVVASLSLLDRFNGSTKDLIKDIYLQTEMLNILYKKMNFKCKNETCRLNFQIDSIISPGKDLQSDSEYKISVEEFVEKFAKKKPFCLTVGMDMALNSTDMFYISNLEKYAGACLTTNTLIVSHGMLDHPAPMALHFASYFKAITHAMGAKNDDKTCHGGAIPNPMAGIEKYFLSKEIKPETSYGVFSRCNVEEIEKILPTKTCLQHINYSTCGNAVRESDEQCDCGPEEHCDAVDHCCMPAIPQSFRRSSQKNVSSNKECIFRFQAQCSKNDPCCNQCKFASNGTKCINGTESCDFALCTGKSAECTCLKDVSFARSPCQGLECGTIPCARVGLRPCLCEDKKECLVCCYKHGTCQSLTHDLKLLGDTLFAFPDKTSCGNDGLCNNGTCVAKTVNLSNLPKIARAEVGPAFAGDQNRTATNKTSSGNNYLYSCKSFVIFFMFTLELFYYHIM